MSKRHLVLLIPPWLCAPSAALATLLGGPPLGGAFRWRPDTPARVVVLRKNDLAVVFDGPMPSSGAADEPSLSAYHFSAAWDEDGGGAVVAQVCRLNGGRAALEANFGDMYAAEWDPSAFCSLADVRVDLAAGTVAPARPALPAPAAGGGDPPLPMEFPAVNSAFLAGRRPRFVWYPAFSGASQWFDALQRADMETGVCATRRFPPGDTPSEPVFVPDPARADREDGGWLLVPVYRAQTHASFVLVLDASDVSALQPLATVRLPHHAPYSFHGCWVPGMA